jgi:hypothetical protein
MRTVDALAAAAVAAATLAAVWLCLRALWNHVLYERIGIFWHLLTGRVPPYFDDAIYHSKDWSWQ